MDVNDTIPIIDFHAHILPGVDHGSASVAMSLNLLKQAKAAGVRAIVATPHFYAHRMSVDAFLERRARGYEALRTAMRGTEVENIRIFCGAEVALEQGLLERGGVERLVIEGTNTLLLELPLMERWHTWVYDSVYDIEQTYGVSVIIAHLDRYLGENIGRLLNMGVTAQVNASGLMTGRRKKEIHELCERGYLHVIGSDVHDDKERNYNDLAKVRRKVTERAMSRFYTNALELLHIKDGEI